MIPPEDRLYQTQYFAEIFPSPLALTLQIHFYLHLQELAYNAFWIVITVKSTAFSARESAPETTFHSRNYVCYAIPQKLD